MLQPAFALPASAQDYPPKPIRIIVGPGPDIVARINMPDIKDRLASEGAAIVGSTPEQYAAVIRSHIAKWAKVIESSGIRAV